MVLKLKQLFDIVGEKKQFDYSIDDEVLKDYNNYTFVSPIRIYGSIANRAGIVSLDFTAVFTMKHECDRCLSEFEREYKYSFTHMVVRNLNTDNDDYIVCKDDTLDLDTLAISDILLQLPTKILCREDCKGLCYICGNNLNISDCGCNRD